MPHNVLIVSEVTADGDRKAASPDYPVPVRGAGFSSSASKTRPNDTNAYSAGDVLAESTSAGTVWTFTSIAPSGGGKILITNASLEIDVAAVPSGMTTFRLHLYSTSPTAINDNAAMDLPSGDRAKYLGFIELPTPLAITSTLWSETEAQNYAIRKQVVAASDTLYGILQTVGAYTPTAQVVKKVTLHSIRLQ